MAKPLANFPSFPLLIFSSDNRFKTIHVTKRWNYIVNELKKVNIEVLSISSDSDPRYNGAMRISSMLGKTSNIFNADWFCSGLSELFKGPFTFQDVLHIITKLRNLILRTLYYRGKLPIGDQNFVQIAHLQFLLNNFSKDEHQLTQSILDPVDKQNVASALRMCDSKVIGLLKEHLTTSDGTVLFLEMMQSIVDSFYDYKLLPLDRIAKMWYPNFILRLWRDYIESQPNLTVRDNFVTPATYACIEVNAHSIVQLIIHLKNDGLDEWFLPFLYDSQECESFFRQVRSLTTVHCRVANCSVKEIIARMNRIQLLNDITNKSEFEFPRAQYTKDFAKYCRHELPTKEQIFEKIEQCRLDAIDYARKIGLLGETDMPNLVCKIPSLESKENTEVQRENQSPLILQKNSLNTLSQLKAIKLKNFAGNFEGIIPENSSYVEVYNDGDKRVVVKKSSLCWLLRDDPGKLSSDRIQRVQGIMKKNRLRIKKKQVVPQSKKIIQKPKFVLKPKPVRKAKFVRVIHKKKNE